MALNIRNSLKLNSKLCSRPPELRPKNSRKFCLKRKLHLTCCWHSSSRTMNEWVTIADDGIALSLAWAPNYVIEKKKRNFSRFFFCCALVASAVSRERIERPRHSALVHLSASCSALAIGRSSKWRHVRLSRALLSLFRRSTESCKRRRSKESKMLQTGNTSASHEEACIVTWHQKLDVFLFWKVWRWLRHNRFELLFVLTVIRFTS